MNLLVLFIILNIVNVILQTIKNLATIKCGKAAAAIVNAIAYGLYTVVLVYTNADLPLWQKVAVVAASNMVGVYVVKWLEEKLRKNKLWKIEATFREEFLESIVAIADKYELSFNWIPVGKYVAFNFYATNREESTIIKKEIIDTFNGKYFASETKFL